MELSELSRTNYDFAGRATCANVLCTDGRTILPDAFAHQDGEIVPLVWNHQHEHIFGVLGSALLHSRNGDMYAYCCFNDTEQGQTAKQAVKHGDVSSLSICANQLKQNSKRGVMHGVIREVSLVLAGANPKARIESVNLYHSEDGNEFDEEIHVYTGEGIELFHSDDNSDKEENKMADNKNAGSDKTVQQVFDEMTEEQQAVVYFIADEIAKKNGTNNEEESDMAHHAGNYSVFDTDPQEDMLMHADILTNAIADGPRFGNLRDSVLAHAAENNITDISELFPNDHDLNMPPQWLKDDESWVGKIMSSVHHTPWSRVRALFAKLDEATARARGYIKGDEKKVGMKLAILKRQTKPTTVYIKMAMDRDDLIDIQFDALPWIRAEARGVLDMEMARAFLLGDGRDPGEDDKIDELCIRPILTDDDMYTIKYTVTDGKDFHNDFNSASENDSEAKGVIRAAIKSRKDYKGSGNLTFFTTEDLVTELLLIEDQNGRRIYESEQALCTALRVKNIVTIPELAQEKYDDIYGIFVNMADYNVGADKGGQVTTFEDFNIDYNKEIILMETRCSGALVKPKSAIVLKKAAAAG